MLYLVAIIPPEPLKSEIRQLKLELNHSYNSRHALNSPPHITLLSPFRCIENSRSELLTLLHEISARISAFKISLDNFSGFEPRVIFIDVIATPALIHLQAVLEQQARKHTAIFNYHYEQRPFKPHITLAHKDLSENNYYKLNRELKLRKFKESFTASSFYLLRHNGSVWEISHHFPFSNS